MKLQIILNNRSICVQWRYSITWKLNNAKPLNFVDLSIWNTWLAIIRSITMGDSIFTFGQHNVYNHFRVIGSSRFGVWADVSLAIKEPVLLKKKPACTLRGYSNGIVKSKSLDTITPLQTSSRSLEVNALFCVALQLFYGVVWSRCGSAYSKNSFVYLTTAIFFSFVRSFRLSSLFIHTKNVCS